MLRTISMDKIRALTKGWIQYLKNNQIVELKSKPDGNLNYKRPVQADDLVKFLRLESDFDEAQIKQAIRSVMSSKTSASVTADPTANPQGPKGLPEPDSPNIRRTSRDVAPYKTQSEPSDNVIDAEPVSKKIKFDPNSISDIDYRDKVEEPAQPQKKSRFGKLEEAIRDRSGVSLSEDDVENVFRLLLNPVKKPNQEEPTAKSEEQRINDLRKIKRLVRDTLTDQQRKALLRVLVNGNSLNLSEAEINNADAMEILKTAAEQRPERSGFSKIFRKKHVSLSDLQKAWKDTGYSDDTRDIEKLLLTAGYSKSEIKKVFANVLGADANSDTGYAEPVASQAIVKLADYIERNGLKDDVVAFLKSELNINESIGQKLVVEDIRAIFLAIIQEERKLKDTLVKEDDRVSLGRTKK